MADSKITALTALTSADPANDMIPIVDVSDTPPASGNTKRISINNILAASGTATLASATITGAATVGTTLGVTSDLTVGTNALIVFPATNRVLINQTTAIQGDSLEVTAKTNGGAISLFGRASDNLATIAFRANGAATQKASIQGSDAGLELVTGTTVKQSIDSSTGNVTVSLGNLVMGTANKGIDFSINSAATGMTSELLNDYEEGTFTPTVVGTTADGTIGTYYAQTGRYTKVGRVVTVQVYLAWGGGTGTGDLAFAGLPFTNGSIVNNYASIAIGYFNDIALTALNVPSIYISPNSSRCDLYQFPVGGGATTPVPYDNNGAIMFTATYFTA